MLDRYLVVAGQFMGNQLTTEAPKTAVLLAAKGT